MKTFLYFVGRAKDTHANAMAQDYIDRAHRFSPTVMAELRPERVDPWVKHPTAKKIALDPLGKQLDSDAFSRLFSTAEMQGHDLVFLVGGHDGLPAEWRTKADLLVSLGPMTLPHELARVVATEQIYRAFTILRNHPYQR